MCEVRRIQRRLVALHRLHVCFRQELAEVAVTGCVPGEQRYVVAANAAGAGSGQRCLSADDGLYADRFCRLGELHGPAQVVVVRDGERVDAKAVGSDEQVPALGRSFLEGVVGVAVQLCVRDISFVCACIPPFAVMNIEIGRVGVADMTAAAAYPSFIDTTFPIGPGVAGRSFFLPVFRRRALGGGLLAGRSVQAAAVLLGDASLPLRPFVEPR